MYNAYHGDQSFKDAFLVEIGKHERADSVAQGSYGHEVGRRWKGCAVACSLRSLDKVQGRYARERDISGAYGDHSDLAERLGVPLVLARLEDRIFEGLSKSDSKGWPRRFAEAIKPGSDLGMVWPRLAIWILSNPESGTRRLCSERGRAATDAVVSLFERRITGDEPSKDDWRDARAAAAAAVAAADAADADAAAYAAAAADAAYAVAAADAAAVAYAAAAADAAAVAYAAARREYCSSLASELIRLIEAA